MAVSIVNEWSGTFTQSASFGNMAPSLESVVIALTPANSVGGGSGTPTAGNWLFCLTGWSLNTLADRTVTVAMADDVHSFWRPGGVITASWPGNIPSASAAVSQANANTRTAVWYTPNLVRAPGDEYTAPSGAVSGMAVLVIEVSGLGPWDTVAGVTSNYAAAATSLSLSLGAPSASALVIGAVTGDSSAASQAFAPGGWTALSTVTATNGTNHANDAVLTSAYIVTSGSVSVSGTASSATDLSGVLISVLVTGTNPVPASNNPNWPYLKFEAAFGSGFQTPPDQLVWTDLTSRLWSWDETTGIEFELGEVQATELNLELDNFDGNLSSDWPGSLYYSNALNSNMSFQSGISPWTTQNGATAAQSTAFAFASSPGATGTYSAQVTPNGSTANPGLVSEQFAATAGSAYSVSAWFYSPAGYATGAQVAISWFNASHGGISFVTSTATAIPAGTWTQVSLPNQTAPGGTAFAAITVQFSGTPTATPFYVAEAALASGASAVTTGLITTGTPLRLRAALSAQSGSTVNRWYVIARNSTDWPQQITTILRRFAPVTGTDIWSAMSNTCPTPYRGEVFKDSPQSWWACDDQPLSGGVPPTALRNSALGNTNTLNVYPASAGVGVQNSYSTTGTVLTSATLANTPPPSVAIYEVAQQSGWMYGDPQTTAASFSFSSGNPVTSSPGSAGWTQAGLLGNTGTNSWFLAANDSSFPPLSGGITFGVWFNAGFFGSATGYTVSTQKYDVAAQPVSAITIATLATASAPVAILQLDGTTGNLNFITYNGATPTSNSIYTSSDLRSNSWHHIMVTMTTTAWTVYLDGGLNAQVSGTATGMTSAWTWLALGADFGAAGGSSLTSNQHGGNITFSHVQVFSTRLPVWRIFAHYCAAVTAFGLVPAPQAVQVSSVNNEFAGISYVPDGSIFDGSYGFNGVTLLTYSFSALAVAVCGSFTSGPSARSTFARYGQLQGSAKVGDGIWVQWISVAPSVDVYTSASANTETQAAVCNGSGDSFSSGYGSGAVGAGVCQTAGGSGAAFPTSPSSLGDTVGQRLERILGYGQSTYPGRCIDNPATAVQSATDVGGQDTGTNLQNIAQSDVGMLYVDNVGNITYWSRTHLASQYSTPVWSIGPALIPYYREIDWKADAHRVWNTIAITPFSPTNAILATVVPQSAAAVIASQEQYGAQPYQQINYLQSSTEQQNIANWLFTNFGTLRIRADNVQVDAAAHPAAWPLFLGANVGDVVTVQNWQIGSTGITDTFRTTQIHRRLVFGGQVDEMRAEIVLTVDYEPTSYPA